MSKWNPNDHLPECGVTRYPICICDRLRACEQRVLDAAWVAIGNIGCATTTHGDDWRDRDPAMVKRDALAAIDTLREGNK